jgi:hypothetical protein
MDAPIAEEEEGRQEAHEEADGAELDDVHARAAVS